jgi:hypothetical protein
MSYLERERDGVREREGRAGKKAGGQAGELAGIFKVKLSLGEI